MRSDCMPTEESAGCSLNNFEHWQRDGHKIQRCDGSTGHFVRDVAFCDSEETAERLIQAVCRLAND